MRNWSGGLSLNFIAVAGFIAGHACMPNLWFHFGWLLLGVAVVAKTASRVLAERALWPVWLFLAYMSVRSALDGGPEVWPGLAGACLLVLFIVLLWTVAASEPNMRLMGLITGHVAAVAALVSLIWMEWHSGDWSNTRLENVLVHGGLNSVCTGLIFGFTGLWLCSLAGGAPQRVLAWACAVLLHSAVFLTASRGAMLALLCGHAVLLWAQGWRRGRAALSVFIVTAAFHFVGRPASGVASGHLSPAAQVVVRGDSGRMAIYEAGLSAMEGASDRVFGIGQWGSSARWQMRLPHGPSALNGHLHSAFLGTLVHGGILGAAFLLVVLIIVGQRAWRLARSGCGTWPALFGFGCCGLIFDGESLSTLHTLPRFEGLLFWLPVIKILAHARQIRV